MYKLIIWDAFDESEVQPYQELDLGALFPYRAIGDTEGNWQAEGMAPESLRDLAPLLLLIFAREKAEAIQQEAYEQGMAKGREEIQKDLRLSLDAFARAAEGLVTLEEQLISRYAPQIVRLALEIAEKIVGKHVEEDPQVVASVLERAKAVIPDARRVRIWLHPADYRVLVELRPDLVQVGEEGSGRVEVLTSEEIGRGGCRVEKGVGVVDATLTVQRDEIRRQMLDE